MSGTPLTTLSLEQLRKRTSIKWRAYPPDTLPLWVAEMDTPLAPPIAAALTEAIALGDTGYPSGHAYAEAAAGFAAARWGWDGLDVARTRQAADVMNGLKAVLRVLSEPGDTVVVGTPLYPPFALYVADASRRLLQVAMTEAGRLDFDALEDAFRRARADSVNPVFLLCNPHNPTGVVHTRAELEAVAALADRHGLRVVSDEIHAPLIFDDAVFTPYLSVDGSEAAFALLSATKGWNLAGIKSALIIAGPAATADLRALPEVVEYGPSHLGVIAHTAALRHGGPWLDDLMADLERNRTLLGELLSARLPELGYHRPQGTYLAWLDCAALGVPDVDHPTPGVLDPGAGPGAFFVERARVVLNSGHAFGAGGRDHVRLNFATSPDILTGAVERMAEAVRTHLDQR